MLRFGTTLTRVSARFCNNRSMQIKISSNGDTFLGDPLTKLRIGNVAESCPKEISSKTELRVELELPNFHCNIGGEDPTTGQMACLMCPRSLRDFKREDDKIAAVCDSLRPHVANIQRLEISGLAEPFWRGRIFEILESLDVNRDSNIRVVTTTNGTLLDKPTRDRWFDLVPQSDVRFSIDATNTETYVRIRRIHEFDLVVENMNQYCRERDPDRHVAVLGNNINMLNVDELDEMVQMTKDNFCHFLSLVPTASVGRHLNEICLNPSNESIFREAAGNAKRKAKELKVNVRFSGNWPA